jgi:hypothetical protein
MKEKRKKSLERARGYTILNYIRNDSIQGKTFFITTQLFVLFFCFSFA